MSDEKVRLLLSATQTEYVKLASQTRQTAMQEVETVMHKRMELLRAELGLPANLQYRIEETGDPAILAVEYDTPHPTLADLGLSQAVDVSSLDAVASVERQLSLVADDAPAVGSDVASDATVAPI